MESVRNVIGRTDVIVAEVFTTHTTVTHKWAARNLTCRSDYWLFEKELMRVNIDKSWFWITFCIALALAIPGLPTSAFSFRPNIFCLAPVDWVANAVFNLLRTSGVGVISSCNNAGSGTLLTDVTTKMTDH